MFLKAFALVDTDEDQQLQTEIFMLLLILLNVILKYFSCDIFIFEIT